VALVRANAGDIQTVSSVRMNEVERGRETGKYWASKGAPLLQPNPAIPSEMLRREES
jgi:hypothetical protein